MEPAPTRRRRACGSADPGLGADTTRRGGNRAALDELPISAREELCIVSLLTTGEALRPYLSVTTHGDQWWDVVEGDHAIHADHLFAALADEWDSSDPAFDQRISVMEEALRSLDVGGAFGAGPERERVLLLVQTLPPDWTEAGRARRLNPLSALMNRWLTEAAETPPLADLWLQPREVLLDDGTLIYGPDAIAERNATFEVAAYAPGWLLVGDDSGGLGYLMRRAGDGFDPALGRLRAEVFQLDLGALTEDVDEAGEYVTDDLVGWLSVRK